MLDFSALLSKLPPKLPTATVYLNIKNITKERSILAMSKSRRFFCVDI